MKHAAPVRRELAARTVFNVLGPLTNPAGARAQVVGVYDAALVRTIADVLVQLDARRAYRRARRRRHRRALAGRPEPRLRGRRRSRARVRARPARPRHRALRPGGAARRRARARTRARSARSSTARDGGHRSAILLNAAGAIAAGGHAADLREGFELAREAVDSGAAASASSSSSPSRARRCAAMSATSGRSPAARAAAKDMSRSAARVTHLPPRCDRAYRRNRNMSATELRRDVRTRSGPQAPSSGAVTTRRGRRCDVRFADGARRARVRRDRRVQAALAVRRRPPAGRRRRRRSRAPTSANGARAMSVLVDERFGGSWDDLRAARAATTLPLLAKGFFTHDRTTCAPPPRRAPTPRCSSSATSTTSPACGAPARGASALGIDTLVEAHDAEELERAPRAARARSIGVNARDLSHVRDRPPRRSSSSSRERPAATTGSSSPSRRSRRAPRARRRSSPARTRSSSARR